MRRIGEDSLLWRLTQASTAEWIAFGVALSVVVVLIWLSFWIRSWFRDDVDPEAAKHQMLAQIGDLHRQGDLSVEEYRSIKSRLVEELEDSPRVQGPPANQLPDADADSDG